MGQLQKLLVLATTNYGRPVRRHQHRQRPTSSIASQPLESIRGPVPWKIPCAARVFLRARQPWSPTPPGTPVPAPSACHGRGCRRPLLRVRAAHHGRGLRARCAVRLFVRARGARPGPAVGAGDHRRAGSRGARTPAPRPAAGPKPGGGAAQQRAPGILRRAHQPRSAQPADQRYRLRRARGTAKPRGAPTTSASSARHRAGCWPWWTTSCPFPALEAHSGPGRYPSRRWSATSKRTWPPS